MQVDYEILVCCIRGFSSFMHVKIHSMAKSRSKYTKTEREGYEARKKVIPMDSTKKLQIRTF